MKSFYIHNSFLVGYHGSAGPVKVSDTITTPLAGYFVKAGNELGHKVRNLNGESQYGKIVLICVVCCRYFEIIKGLNEWLV